MDKPRNFFPDWLFYLTSAAAVMGIGLALHYYLRTGDLDSQLNKAKTEMTSARDTISSLNKSFSQYPLQISNEGTAPVQVLMMTVYYKDAKNQIQVVENFSDIAIDGGSTCQPGLSQHTTVNWNGDAIFYSIYVRYRNLEFQANGLVSRDTKEGVLTLNYDNYKSPSDLIIRCQ